MSLSYTLTSLLLGLITFGSNLLTVNNLEAQLVDAVANQDYVFVEKAGITDLL